MAHEPSDVRQWGSYGGRYVSQLMWSALEELARSYDDALADPEFVELYRSWLEFRVGRPTPLSRLGRLSAELGGATLWAKREDLLQGGSFCTSLAVFQALLARRCGAKVLVAETSTGDFGLALASIAAALGLELELFISREDAHHEPARIEAITSLGARVEIVDASTRGRKAARAHAWRRWIEQHPRAFYCTSLLSSPDPFPRMIEHVLAVIGRETAAAMHARRCDVDYMIAPVGSGGFAAGMFSPFLSHEDVQLVGVLAGGEPQAARNSTTLITGSVGVFHGTKTMVLHDADGNITTPYSVASGLAVAAVGPQHAHWARMGEVIYVSINDREARAAARSLAKHEGILVSLEAAHAVSYAMKLLPTLPADANVVVGLTGAGDRDITRYSGVDDE